MAYRTMFLLCGKSSCRLKEEYATVKEEVDRKTTVEATTSRNDHAQANRTAIEKAEEYWPQYVSTHKYLDMFHKPRIGLAVIIIHVTVLHVGGPPAIGGHSC